MARDSDHGYDWNAAFGPCKKQNKNTAAAELTSNEKKPSSTRDQARSSSFRVKENTEICNREQTAEMSETNRERSRKVPVDRRGREERENTTTKEKQSMEQRNKQPPHPVARENKMQSRHEPRRYEPRRDKPRRYESRPRSYTSNAEQTRQHHTYQKPTQTSRRA